MGASTLAAAAVTDPRRDGLARAAVDGVERDLSLELGELVALLVDALTSLLAPVLHVLDLLLEQVALVRVLTSQLVQIGCNRVASAIMYMYKHRYSIACS